MRRETIVKPLHAVTVITMPRMEAGSFCHGIGCSRYAVKLNCVSVAMVLMQRMVNMRKENVDGDVRVGKQRDNVSVD